MVSNPRRRAGLAAVVLLLGGLTACSPGAARTGSSPTPSAAALAASDANPSPSTGPGALLKMGSKIEVHDYGFNPEWLIDTCCGPVTWVNDTSKPVRIVAPTVQLDSGMVPPNGTYSWTPPNPEAVGYYLDSTPRYWGKIQVNP